MSQFVRFYDCSGITDARNSKMQQKYVVLTSLPTIRTKWKRAPVVSCTLVVFPFVSRCCIYCFVLELQSIFFPTLFFLNYFLKFIIVSNLLYDHEHFPLLKLEKPIRKDVLWLHLECYSECFLLNVFWLWWLEKNPKNTHFIHFIISETKQVLIYFLFGCLLCWWYLCFALVTETILISCITNAIRIAWRKKRARIPQLPQLL